MRAAGGERRGFGINSLINRMTGAGSEEAPSVRTADPRASEATRPPRPLRAQVAATTPNPASRVRPEHSAEGDDHDRVEIPAFLRRQAN